MESWRGFFSLLSDEAGETDVLRFRLLIPIAPEDDGLPGTDILDGVENFIVGRPPVWHSL